MQPRTERTVAIALAVLTAAWIALAIAGACSNPPPIISPVNHVVTLYHQDAWTLTDYCVGVSADSIYLESVDGMGIDAFPLAELMTIQIHGNR